MNDTLYALAEKTVALLSEKGLTVTSAESCTGGLFAKTITDVPGSSRVFSGSFVTYSNEVKIKAIGVSPSTIDKFTEVSDPCAREMANGAKNAIGADYAVSFTGFAGPGGGSEQNPVGTVFIGISTPNGTDCKKIFVSDADRETVRITACRIAFEMLLQLLQN